MKVLITGSNGFLANALCRFLVEHNIEVIGLSKTESSLIHPLFTNLIADLSDSSFIELIPLDVEIIIHTAQSNSFKENLHGAVDMFKINVQSTFELANWAFKNSISKFIFTSTGSVYSPKSTLIMEEDDCEPLTFYGASKLAAENLLRPYQSKLSIVNYRIFGLYGKGQTNKVIPNLINSVLKGNPITLADGKGMIFNPVNIMDCIHVIYQEINKVRELGYASFNLAGNEITDLGQIVSTLTEHLKIEPNIISQNQLPVFLVADISSLKLAYDCSAWSKLSLTIPSLVNI